MDMLMCTVDHDTKNQWATGSRIRREKLKSAQEVGFQEVRCMSMSAPTISCIDSQNAKRKNRGEVEQEKGTLILLEVFHIDSVLPTKQARVYE